MIRNKDGIKDFISMSQKIHSQTSTQCSRPQSKLAQDPGVRRTGNELQHSKYVSTSVLKFDFSNTQR